MRSEKGDTQREGNKPEEKAGRDSKIYIARIRPALRVMYFVNEDFIALVCLFAAALFFAQCTPTALFSELRREVVKTVVEPR